MSLRNTSLSLFSSGLIYRAMGKFLISSHGIASLIIYFPQAFRSIFSRCFLPFHGWSAGWHIGDRYGD